MKNKHDEMVIFITAITPVVFEQRMNDLLRDGNWRVAQTEMSVTDNHYWALLIKSRSEKDDK